MVLLGFIERVASLPVQSLCLGGRDGIVGKKKSTEIILFIISIKNFLKAAFIQVNEKCSIMLQCYNEVQQRRGLLED